MDDIELAAAVCRQLHLMAKSEDDEAADEAAASPYWKPTPAGVMAHRAAARVLRDAAFRLERTRLATLNQAV